MGFGGCPVCMGLAGSAVISNRQTVSFKKSFSKVWALNSSETHWHTFPVDHSFIRKWNWLQGFSHCQTSLTKSNFFQSSGGGRSINSFLSFPALHNFTETPISTRIWGTPQGRGWSGAQAVEWVWCHFQEADPSGWDFFFSMWLSLSFKLKHQFHRTDFSLFKNEGFQTWHESPYCQYNLVT